MNVCHSGQAKLPYLDSRLGFQVQTILSQTNALSTPLEKSWCYRQFGLTQNDANLEFCPG